MIYRSIYLFAPNAAFDALPNGVLDDVLADNDVGFNVHAMLYHGLI